MAARAETRRAGAARVDRSADAAPLGSVSWRGEQGGMISMGGAGFGVNNGGPSVAPPPTGCRRRSRRRRPSGTSSVAGTNKEEDDELAF